MSHAYRALSANRTATVSRLTGALRKNWNQARLTDRELMALRTNLSRHSG